MSLSFPENIDPKAIKIAALVKKSGKGGWEYLPEVVPDGSGEFGNIVPFRVENLHPVRTARRGTDPSRPFALTTDGWGVFEVGISVVLKNGRTTALKHMLTFVPATISACTSEITLDQRHSQQVNDARFDGDLYVYAGDINDTWKRIPSRITLFVSDSSSWKSVGALRESDFDSKTKQSTVASKWTLRTIRGNETLRFEYKGKPYVLSVTRLQTGTVDRVTLHVCDV